MTNCPILEKFHFQKFLYLKQFFLPLSPQPEPRPQPWGNPALKGEIPYEEMLELNLWTHWVTRTITLWSLICLRFFPLWTSQWSLALVAKKSLGSSMTTKKARVELGALLKTKKKSAWPNARFLCQRFCPGFGGPQMLVLKIGGGAPVCREPGTQETDFTTQPAFPPTFSEM